MTIQEQGNIRIPQITQGDRMRKARELTGMSQHEFADELGVSAKTVWSAEAGEHGVRQITLNAWALATGVPIEWMKTGIVPTWDDGDDGLGADDETRTRNILLASQTDAEVIQFRPAAIEWDQLEQAS